MPAPRHRSSAAPLAFLFAALIAYASLYPFTGWRVPGVSPLAFLTLPWPRWWTWFDLTSNLIGYIPLGALVFGALVRTGSRRLAAALAGIAAGGGLSFVMELMQNFLPLRVASNVDFGLNTLGALLGVIIGWAVDRCGWVDQWQLARDRWFIGRSAGGLALLLLWPIGLLFPAPVPLGVGQVVAPAQEAVMALLADTPAAAWLAEVNPFEDASDGLSPAGELCAVGLGLLAPCLLAFAVSHRSWRRLVLIAGAVVLGMAVTTLSTALNFGPQHALAWSTPRALSGMAAGAVVAAMLCWLPRRAIAGVALIAFTALVMLVGNAPADPYFADSLQARGQGRFIRFHGAARWVGWLWPYVAIAYLLVRLAARDAAHGGMAASTESPP